MKILSLTALLLLTMVSAISQDAGTGSRSHRLQKAKSRQQWLMRYEKVDTTDSRTGRKFTVSRAYYFNKARRQLQTVHIQEVDTRRGLETTFSFYNNQLTHVLVIPPRSECRRCRKEYYFFENKLHSSNDTHDLQEKARVYTKEAAFLKNRMPDKLEWGYFEWEQSAEPNKNQDNLTVSH
jgi:hypothetical protein